MEPWASGYKPLVAKRHTNGAAWGLSLVLATGILAGLGLLGVWLRWY
jgi:hypothetical protein